MATKNTTFTYTSLENLQRYDGNLKPYIEDRIKVGIVPALKTVSLDGNVLQFYNVSEPVGSTKPVYSFELPETDLTSISQLIKANSDAIKTLNGTADVEGSVAKAVKDASDSLQTVIDGNKTAVDNKIGTMSSLTTASKGTIVEAINENKASIDANKESGKLSISTATTSTGMLKSYTIKQGTTTVGTIDIPKDMVVKSGSVETNPTGMAAGTYLVLTLANADEDKVYINVGSLVDIYTTEQSATQIQLNIDGTTRVISANIVAGSVTAAELASNAVTTVKIADNNVTKAKLSTDLQASIDKADTAVQESDISDLRTSVKANTASMASGGTTYNAIAKAQAAADAAQGEVDAVEERVDALEAVKYQCATDDEIDALFTTT